MKEFPVQQFNNNELIKFFKQVSHLDVTQRQKHFQALFPYAEKLPVNLYLQDAIGPAQTLACNSNTFVSLKGISTDILGRNIYYTAKRLNFQRGMAEKIVQDNWDTLKKGLLIVNEQTQEGDYVRNWLSRKETIYSDNGEPLGMLGCSIPLHLTLPRVKMHTDNKHVLVYLSSKESISFTLREFDILQELLKGKTANEIAIHEKVSPKTIETHIMRIKLKLECEKQRDVISLLIHADAAKEISLFERGHDDT